MRKRYNTHFEEVYLFHEQLKTAVLDAEAKAFIESEEVQKIINYSASNSYKKNYVKFNLGGTEVEDVINVTRCYALIFYSRYKNNFANEKHLKYSLCRFLGQKIFRFKTVTEKKFQENKLRVSVSSQKNEQSQGHVVLENLVHKSIKNNIESNDDAENRITEAKHKLTNINIRLPQSKVNHLKRIAEKFSEKTEDEQRSLTAKEFDDYQYNKLATEVYNSYINRRRASR